MGRRGNPKPSRARVPRVVKRRQRNIGVRRAPSRGTVRLSRAPPSYNRRAPRAFMGQSSMAIKSQPSRISIKSARGGQAIRVTGTEFLGPVQVPTTELVDSIYIIKANSAGPSNTRLASFAGIYERWRPYAYSYKFTPSVGSTTSGTLVFAQDPDPATPWVDGASGNIARLRSISGSSMQQVYLPSHSTLPSTRDYTSLWTYDPQPTTINAQDRLDCAGQFIIACAAPTGLTAGKVLGTLELHYDIEFYTPRLSTAATDRTSVFKFTGAAAQLLRSLTASGAASIVDQAIVVLRQLLGYGVTDSGGAEKLLNDYQGISFVPAEETKDEKKAFRPAAPVLDSGGWGPGLIDIKVMVTHPTVAHPWTAGATVQHGCTFRHGTEGTFNMGSWNDPDGNLWSNSGNMFHTMFGSGEAEQKSYSDLAVAWDAGTTSDLTVWLFLTAAGSGAYRQMDSTVPASTKKVVLRPTLPPRPVHMCHEGCGHYDSDADIEDFPPPRSHGPKSSTPGGSMYIPGYTGGPRVAGSTTPRDRRHVLISAEPATGVYEPITPGTPAKKVASLK